MRNLILLAFLGFFWSCTSVDKSSENEIKEDASSELENKLTPPTDNLWGLHFNPFMFHDGNPLREDEANISKDTLDMYMDKVLELGVKSVRQSLEWVKIQKNDGSYDWELHDYVINGLHDRGINIVLSVHGGHPVFSEGLSPATEEHLQNFKSYLENATKRYGEKVKYWEAWNEPNTIWFWKPKPNAKAYANLVKLMHDVVKQNVNDAIFIGGSFARVDASFADSLGVLGVIELMDVFTFHPYSELPEATLKKNRVQVVMPEVYARKMNTVKELKEVLYKYNPEIEIWQGECGYATKMHGLGWNGPGPFNDQVQQMWLMRRAMSDRLSGLQRTFYFCFKDWLNNSKTNINAKGLLRLNNSEKPGFNTVKEMVNLFDGGEWVITDSTFRESLEIVDEGDYPGMRLKDIYWLNYKKGDKTYLIYWIAEGLESVKIPAKISTELGVDLANVKIIDLVYPDTDYVLDENLPVTNYPLILEY